MPNPPLNPLDYGACTEGTDGNDGYLKAAGPMFWDHNAKLIVRIRPDLTKTMVVKKNGDPLDPADGIIDLIGAEPTANGFIARFVPTYNALGWEGVAKVDVDRMNDLPEAWGQCAYAILQSPFNVDCDQVILNNTNQVHVLSEMKAGGSWAGTDIAPLINDCVGDAAERGRGQKIVMPTGKYRVMSDVGIYATVGPRDLFLEIDFGMSTFVMDGGKFSTGGNLGLLDVHHGIQRGRSVFSHDGTFGFRVGGYTNSGLVKLHHWSFEGWRDGPVSGVNMKPGSALWVDGGAAELDDINFHGCTAMRSVASFHNVQNIVGNSLNFYDDCVFEEIARKKNGAEQGWIGIANALGGEGSGTLQGVVFFSNCWFDENYGSGFVPSAPTYHGGILFDANLIPPGADVPINPNSRIRHAELLNCQGRISNYGAGYGCGVKARGVDSLEMRGVCIQRDNGLGQHLFSLEDCGSVRAIGCRGNPEAGGDDILFRGTSNNYYYERGTTKAGRTLAPGAAWPAVMDVID